MNMMVPDTSKGRFLASALGATGGQIEDWTVYLYTNDYTPTDTSTPGDFTAATFTGSAGFVVPVTDWGSPTLASNIATCENASVPQWTNSGGSTETCYGWYAVGNVTGECRCAQRFDSPRSMTPGAIEKLDPFQVQLKLFT